MKAATEQPLCGPLGRFFTAFLWGLVRQPLGKNYIVEIDKKTPLLYNKTAVRQPQNKNSKGGHS